MYPLVKFLFQMTGVPLNVSPTQSVHEACLCNYVSGCLSMLGGDVTTLSHLSSVQHFISQSNAFPASVMASSAINTSTGGWQSTYVVRSQGNREDSGCGDAHDLVWGGEELVSMMYMMYHKYLYYLSNKEHLFFALFFSTELILVQFTLFFFLFFFL